MRRLLALPLLLAPAVARADVLTTTETEPQIYGGEETQQCAWPSVVYLSTNGGACTGALVHPQIVLTAAHCVPGDVTADVRFGENASSAVQLAATEYCRAYPGFDNTGEGDDYAFCKLATPVENIPIIPIAYGCEESVLNPGTEITHVGYGVDEGGESGRKKFVSLDVSTISASGEIITGNGVQTICSGDSGGPVMVRLPAAQGGDDTWRVVGIHSWAQMSSPGECNGAAGSTLASSAVAFIEQESGIDVTPCFDADGGWQPTWGCQGFPIDPATGGDGSYNAMCATGPLGEFSSLCGEPLTATPDTEPPTLAVVSPTGDQMFEVGGAQQADLLIEAEASDGDGWGVASVELIIAPVDGDTVSQSLTYPPYRWNTMFPTGGYNLRLVATDNAGNQTESEWIAIGVGVEAPENPPGEDTGGSDGAADTSGGGDGTTGDVDGTTGEEPIDGDTSGGAAADGDDAGGCGCASSGNDAQFGLLGFVAVAALRRRRAR